jgi:hypothetical protein
MEPWKTGDPCFIAEVNLTPAFPRMRILPAVVQRGTTAYCNAEAIAISPSGRSVIGAPCATEEEARASILAMVAQITQAAGNIRTEGRRPDTCPNNEAVSCVDWFGPNHHEIEAWDHQIT